MAAIPSVPRESVDNLSIRSVWSTRPEIVFVYPGWTREWPRAHSISEAELEREHQRFRRGIDIWILQSYVRLRAALQGLGFRVSISERFVDGAICIAHRDDLNQFSSPMHRCYVVGVRADRAPLRVAVVEIAQNGLDLGTRTVFIPSWPQPFLIPRDSRRGSHVLRLAYLGRCESLPSWYADSEFLGALAHMGIEMELRESRWHDYSEVDVVIAHRKTSEVLLRQKPAAKLVNSWHAGVPAILGPEPAYRELRRDDCDFLETRNAGETLLALDSLRGDPALYNAMVKRARLRAADFTIDAVRGRWLQVIQDMMEPGWHQWRATRSSVAAGYAAHVWNLSAQKASTTVFRWWHGRQLHRNGG